MKLATVLNLRETRRATFTMIRNGPITLQKTDDLKLVADLRETGLKSKDVSQDFQISFTS